METRYQINFWLKIKVAKFDHVNMIIEESKDLAIMTKEKLQGFLKAREHRMNVRETNKANTKATLHSQSNKDYRGGNQGGLRENYRGGNNSRGKGCKKRFDKSNIQCYNCSK